MATKKIRFSAAKSAHFPFPLLEHARSWPLRHAHTKDLATVGSFPNKSRLGPGANYWNWKDSNPIQAANNGLDLGFFIGGEAAEVSALCRPTHLAYH